MSRIVVLEPDDEPVRAITGEYKVEHGRLELAEPERFGLLARA